MMKESRNSSNIEKKVRHASSSRFHLYCRGGCSYFSSHWRRRERSLPMSICSHFRRPTDSLQLPNAPAEPPPQGSDPSHALLYLYLHRLRVLCFFHTFLLPLRVLLNLWPLFWPRLFLPVAVRPRHSRCLWTGLTIQLMRAARRERWYLSWFTPMLVGLPKVAPLGTGRLRPPRRTPTVDDVALLGLVSHAAGLVWARRARGAVDHVQLAELPAANAEQKAHNIALLLLRELLEILVGAHLVGDAALLLGWFPM